MTMMKKLTIALAILTGIFATGPAALAAYDPLGGACSGQAASSPVCQQYANQQNNPNSNPITGNNGVLQTVTNIMALLTGIVAVVMIIISGFTFMTAGGNIAGQRAGDNPSKAKKARAQLTAAVIGLIIVALSWTIITFIIQKFVQS